jgi:hypothetical protein
MTRSWPEIIRAAASSPLGIVALVVLVLGATAWMFFRKEEVKFRAGSFLLLLFGGGLLVAAAMRAPRPGPPTDTGRTTETPDTGPSQRKAVLPERLNYVAIWEAIPRLRAAGFESTEIELTRDDNYIINGRVAPWGIVIGVGARDGSPLAAGRSYPVSTPIRIRLQSNPAWGFGGGVYSKPEEVRNLVEFVQRKELEAEHADTGARHMNR